MPQLSTSARGRFTLRRTATIAAAVTVAAGTLVMTQAGGASAADSTWKINTYGETICRQTNASVFGGYWLAQITGTWSSPLSVGLEDVPGVGTIPSGTIPAGSNTNVINDGGSLNFPMPPAGTYTAEAYASDGTTTQTSPVTLVVQAHC